MDIFSFWTDGRKAKPPYLHREITINTYGQSPGKSPSIQIFISGHEEPECAIMLRKSNDLS
jgi:hypothetical protein